MKQGTNSSQPAELAEKPTNSASGCNKVAGVYAGIQLPEAFVLTNMQSAIDAKAVRRLFAYFKHTINPFIVGSWDLIALSIVSSWCILNSRECGPIDKFVEWSGYTKNWKARVYGGIKHCQEIGALEQIKQNAGYSLAMTGKGQRILDVYEKMRGVVLQEFIDTYFSKIEKKEAKAIAKLKAAA